MLTAPLPLDLKAFYVKGTNGIIRETIDRDLVRDNNLAIGLTGVMFSQQILLFAGDVITSIATRSGSIPASVPLNYWLALYDAQSTPALIGQTADQTTAAWGAATTKDLALTGGPFTIAATGLCWLSIMMVATTIVNLNGMGAASSTIHGGIVSGMIKKSQTSGTGLTTTAPGTIASGTATANSVYMIGH